MRDASFNPKPVQQPHPPIWVGAGGEKATIPLAARKADAWHTFGDLRTLERRTSVLEEEHARSAGRDPNEILRATTLSISEPWDAVAERARKLRELGFTYLEVSWPSEGRARLEEFVDELMPELAEL